MFLQKLLSSSVNYCTKRWKLNYIVSKTMLIIMNSFRFTWCDCWFKDGCSLWMWIASFILRVGEHLVSGRASHIFKHLKDSPHCRALCSEDNFHVLDHASTGFQLKIKEAIHIQREQPYLNQQLHHVNLTLSF